MPLDTGSGGTHEGVPLAGHRLGSIRKTASECQPSVAIRRRASAPTEWEYRPLPALGDSRLATAARIGRFVAAVPSRAPSAASDWPFIPQADHPDTWARRVAPYATYRARRPAHGPPVAPGNTTVTGAWVRPRLLPRRATVRANRAAPEGAAPSRQSVAVTSVRSWLPRARARAPARPPQTPR